MLMLGGFGLPYFRKACFTAAQVHAFVAKDLSSVQCSTFLVACCLPSGLTVWRICMALPGSLWPRSTSVYSWSMTWVISRTSTVVTGSFFIWDTST